MLENVTKVIARFFGIIAGSLSGISAILIAIGYLAERSHLKMLGFTSIPVDLNQYLYTGANLLSFLPGIIIVQSILLFREPLILGILSLILLMFMSMRIRKWKNSWHIIIEQIQKNISKFKILFLIIFVFVQILSLKQMVQAVLVENLLFPEIITSSTQPEFIILNTDTQTLKQLLISKDTKDKEELFSYFTQLFLITFLIGLVIRYLTFVDKGNQSAMNFHLKFWLVINFLLFATHVILLPGNYGVLLLNNKYQEVQVQFKEVEQKLSHQDSKVLALIDHPAKLNNIESIDAEMQFNDLKQKVPPKDSMALDLNNNPPKFVNAIRNQQIELEGLPFKYDLEATPKVFVDPDGDDLTYSAKSDKPNIVRSDIDKNFLTISPVQKGKAFITVIAKDTEGKLDSTSFIVNIVDSFIPFVMETANQTSQITLEVGETTFVRDLIAEPSVFKLTKEPPDITFQASSSSKDVAFINIIGNKLIVQPISKGNALITVTANDGFGRLITAKFNLTVLGKNLEWPQDNRLLLLYQSNNIFFLYSKREKRIWYVRSEDIESMVYYGLVELF